MRTFFDLVIGVILFLRKHKNTYLTGKICQNHKLEAEKGFYQTTLREK